MTPAENYMKYCIRLNDKYLAPITGSVYPVWTSEKYDARTFYSQCNAQSVIETWKLDGAQIVAWK